MHLQIVQHHLRSLNVLAKTGSEEEEQELEELQNAMAAYGLWIAWSADQQLYVIVDKEQYFQKRD